MIKDHDEFLPMDSVFQLSTNDTMVAKAKGSSSSSSREATEIAWPEEIDDTTSQSSSRDGYDDNDFEASFSSVDFHDDFQDDWKKEEPQHSRYPAAQRLAAQSTTSQNDKETTASATSVAKTQLQSAFLQRRTLNRVRFAVNDNDNRSAATTTCNQYHENHLYPAEDCKSFWCEQSDFARFRLFSNFVVGTVQSTAASTDEINVASSFVELFERTYGTCCFRAKQEQHQQQAKESDSDDDDANSRVLGTSDMNLLQDIYNDTGGPMLLGLEKSIVKAIARDIADRREELVYLVQELQQQYRQKQHDQNAPKGANGENVDEDKQNHREQLAQDIRVACQRISGASTKYARVMAETMLRIT